MRVKASKFSRVPPGRRHEAAEFPRLELVVRLSRTLVHHRGIRDDKRWPPALAEPEELENRTMLVGELLEKRMEALRPVVVLKHWRRVAPEEARVREAREALDGSRDTDDVDDVGEDADPGEKGEGWEEKHGGRGWTFLASPRGQGQEGSPTSLARASRSAE